MRVKRRRPPTLAVVLRQTRDPWVDDPQYIAYSRVIIRDNEDPDMLILGFGKPGGRLVVRSPS